MSKIFHALITRFSITNLFGEQCEDVLSPQQLTRRLAIFEFTCLATVLKQSMQDFSWFIFIDPALPDEFRIRLEKLVNQRARSFVIPFDYVTYKHGLDYFTDHLKCAPEYVLTTLLDSDDALHTDCFQYQRQLCNKHAATGLTELLFMGFENVVQWDLRTAENAPFGYEKPWTRKDFAGRAYPVSAGMSLLVKYPELALSISQFDHAIVANACRVNDERVLQRDGLRERVQKTRALITRTCNASRASWDGTLDLTRHYHACALPSPQAVMVNHNDNLQQRRLFEALSHSISVDPQHSFANIPVDFAQARSYMGRQEKQTRQR